MKLEKQCCTLEQAEQLKTLGLTENSCFCFVGDGSPEVPYAFMTEQEAVTECGKGWYDERINAYSVAELSIMIPVYSTRTDNCDVAKGRPERVINTHKGRQFGFYLATRDFNLNVYAKTEAEAKAHLLILFLENGIVTAEEANKRLAAE